MFPYLKGKLSVISDLFSLDHLMSCQFIRVQRAQYDNEAVSWALGVLFWNHRKGLALHLPQLSTYSEGASTQQYPFYSVSGLSICHA